MGQYYDCTECKNADCSQAHIFCMKNQEFVKRYQHISECDKFEQEYFNDNEK